MENKNAEKYIIRGGNPLRGEVTVSGAKNAAVAILPACILADSPCIIENVPVISDIAVVVSILKELGAGVKYINDNTLEIDPRTIENANVSYENARAMRASYYFMGALLARGGYAHVALPGGCELGDRPMDQHQKAFSALGARHIIHNGYFELWGSILYGTQIYFDKVTVGATINALLAATKARGLTVIENAAKEPHVVDLANFLNSMGANIIGAGTDVIRIHGVEELHGSSYSVIPDQIEAGTFMVAAAVTRGNVKIYNIIPKHLEKITAKLRKVGVCVEEYDDYLIVKGRIDRYDRENLKTTPHPGFPTDMQPQMAVLLALAVGTSIITEGVFDNRFRYADELRRMGANIAVDGKVAVIEGVQALTGAQIKAADLRAGAALVIAGLVAEGETEIEDIYHIERGYEDMVSKLSNLGADISKLSYVREIKSIG